MVVFKPFRAFRPLPNLAEKVAELPYDVMNSEEARKIAKDNPYSFLHVDKAEIDLNPAIDLYDERVYLQARANLAKLIAEGTLIQDNNRCFYLYQQTMNGRSQIGLVGCTSIDDYSNEIIKKHEFTRADKEADRIKHVDYCNANTGPIFLTYRPQQRINQLVDAWLDSHVPSYDFITDDGIGHTVWVIDDVPTARAIEAAFENLDYLYIADGHHRAASAVKVGQKRRAEKPDYTGLEEFNFFLAVLFPADQLRIMDYNRVVKDLNGYTSAEFINKLSKKFVVEEAAQLGSYKPEVKHTFGMYLDNKWYKLTAKEGIYNKDNPVERLDVSILQNNILEPILGIADPRTDKRIDFIGGIRGLKELERRVASGMKVAFSMYPTTLNDLMAIADAGTVMPPKSTWFEPKLRSGLFVHDLS